MKYFVLLFLVFLVGCGKQIDNTLDRVLVEPIETSKQQVESAKAAKAQLESLQSDREAALDDILNQ